MSTPTDAPIRLTRQQLAAELDCSDESISVVSVEETEWNDSALGCPQPGMMYLQVITPGYRIILEQNGQQYTYHTDRRARVIRCDHGSSPHLAQ